MTNGAERTRWKIRSDRLVDENPQIRLSVASLELADGTLFDQYVMRLPRCAMTVVLDQAAERILLIWRHRFIIDRWLWELPGGYIDPGVPGARRRPSRSAAGRRGRGGALDAARRTARADRHRGDRGRRHRHRSSARPADRGAAYPLT